MSGVLTTIPIGSARNIARHLNNLEDFYQVLSEDAGEAVSRQLFTRMREDVESESLELLRNIGRSPDEDLHRALMEATIAAKVIMREYRHIMGDKTPEIARMELALEAVDKIQV